jgi:hypothetical protein
VGDGKGKCDVYCRLIQQSREFRKHRWSEVLDNQRGLILLVVKTNTTNYYVFFIPMEWFSALIVDNPMRGCDVLAFTPSILYYNTVL